MKTIQDLQKELDVLLDNAGQYKNTKPPKKLTDEIKTVRQLIRYLETNPTEETVWAQIGDVKRKLDFIPKRYKGWYERLSKKRQGVAARPNKGPFQQGTRCAEAAHPVTNA